MTKPEWRQPRAKDPHQKFPRRQRDWAVEGKPFPITEEDAAFVRTLLVHEDQHILAFNKPSGISAQAGKEGIKTLDRLLTAFAKSNGKRPQLDWAIAARNSKAAGICPT